MAIDHLHRRIKINRVLQWAARIALRLIYRIKIEGAIDTPTGKGVLLIANHVSFVDFLMMALIVPLHRVVFSVMDYELYQQPGLKFVCRNAAAIPIASKKTSLEVRENAFAQIKELLTAGHFVLFFPEGMVTYSGALTPFQYGLERIKTENPECFIVPITISGLLGGFFSRVGGLFAKGKLIREFGRRVTLRIGPSIPALRWNLEHIETKVKLMLASEKGQEILSPEPIELPAVRETRRISFSAQGDETPPSAKILVGGKGDGFRLVFLDHSSEGFCINIAQPLEKDTVVKIVLENLGTTYTCSVRWCEEQAPGSYKVGLKIMGDSSRHRFLDLAGNY